MCMVQSVSELLYPLLKLSTSAMNSANRRSIQHQNQIPMFLLSMYWLEEHQKLPLNIMGLLLLPHPLTILAQPTQKSQQSQQLVLLPRLMDSALDLISHTVRLKGFSCTTRHLMEFPLENEKILHYPVTMTYLIYFTSGMLMLVQIS